MPRPKVFEHSFRVIPADIDRLGHVNNVVFLRYAQDVAVAHWFAEATREQRNALSWVVRRHEVDYLKPAFPDDELVARTWIDAANGATFERVVEIRRASEPEVITRIRSVWVAIDPVSFRPRRVSEDLRLGFFEDDPEEGPAT